MWIPLRALIVRELNNYRQMLALGLLPLEQGDKLVKSKWPLHVTLVPWFEHAKQNKLRRELGTVAQRARPVEAVLGEKALFGFVEKIIPVWTINENYQLRQLHDSALRAVYVSAGELPDLRSVSYNYRPHITVRNNEPVEPTFTLSSVALIRDVGNGERLVEEVYDFSNQTEA